MLKIYFQINKYFICIFINFLNCVFVMVYLLVDLDLGLGLKLTWVGFLDSVAFTDVLRMNP